jgi:predicted Zn-dependent peptidase
LVHAISATTWGSEDAGLMWVGWSGDAETDPQTVEVAIEEVVQAFLAEGPTVEELTKARRQAVVGMVNASKTVHGAASRAAHALAVARDERQPMASARQLASLGLDEILAASRRALTDAARTAVSMRATEPAAAAAQRDGALFVGRVTS